MRICDVKALVEPLPLVPEMWMMLSGARSETAYPIRERYSLISGSARELSFPPEARRALRIAWLDWRVLREDMAS